MHSRSHRASLLLALNWLLFAANFIWVCATQGNLLWWLRLNWGGWLSDLSAFGAMGHLPAGSVWILWLIISLVLTIIYLPRPSQRAVVAEAAAESPARKPLIPNAELIDSRPELKEKILRLHQSLDKI